MTTFGTALAAAATRRVGVRRRARSLAIASSSSPPIVSLSRRRRSSSPPPRPGGRNEKKKKKANVAVVGAGWWSQGWHLPHLRRNADVDVAAIVDRSDRPTSSLEPDLEPLSSLSDRYGAPIFSSVSDLLNDPNVGPTIDGAIVCTTHATHHEIGKELLREGSRRRERAAATASTAASGGEEDGYRPMNVLMEKPMTTNVRQARELRDLAVEASASSVDKAGGRSAGGGCFLVNHSANYRPQARAARSIIESGTIGTIRHASGFLASPLSWIFDDPSNVGWNVPDVNDDDMIGNGFAWGQSTHLLAWIYHATCGTVIPERAHCVMNHSTTTGADVSHSASIRCENGVTLGLSGTSLLPGNAHSDPPVGKMVRIEIFGTEGSLTYAGDDRDPTSGRLEVRRGAGGGSSDGEDDAGKVELPCPDLGFEFENLSQDGSGPESLRSFVDACLGREYYVGADGDVGLRTVQTVDAMYRSHASGNAEDVRCG